MPDPMVIHRQIIIDYDDYIAFRDVIKMEIDAFKTQINGKILLGHCGNITITTNP